MLPWLWFWSPTFQPQWNIHYPLSGDVAQRFFQSINPAAGNAAIEAKAFEVASYGKQLGLITEVLIDLAEQARLSGSTESLAKLKKIRGQIERIKQLEYGHTAKALR